MIPVGVGRQADAPAAQTQSDTYEQNAYGHDIPIFVHVPEWHLDLDLGGDSKQSFLAKTPSGADCSRLDGLVAMIQQGPSSFV